ncbi:transcriptional regulator [Planobispora rosea]|uniref:Transcriptional regulator n=1 Tax=Planobispora rosea TaxID=35762 RepID=A0A8J3S1U3_PLARO|nr:helix-turn-helix transcriptional regulator [Planobispora rosea]GGS82518.1 transcriptional regulator [Planobispora rosea]GIH84237.1 transcriptional regulator [Planobispora rosea]
MARDVSPTVSRRRLAAELRRLREDAHLTGGQVAKALGWSTSKISRIENAQVGAQKDDVATLVSHYGVSEEWRDLLLELSRESEEKGWWEDYADVLSESYSTYIGLEAGASELVTWQGLVVPGLLQTAAYARATMRTTSLFLPALPGKAARLVHVRMRRQRLLDEDPPLRFTALIDEAILRRRFGTAETMQQQLRHILKIAEFPHVVIRVLPLHVNHPSLPSSFVLLKFPERERLGRLHGDVLYLENALDATFEEGEETTYGFDMFFQQMVEESLSPEESLALIAEEARLADPGGNDS